MTDKAAPVHAGIRKWVDDIAAMTKPDRILVCDGSEGEREQQIREFLA
jgi:phosphoenolpyruvate carboxykinase (GTP)